MYRSYAPSCLAMYGALVWAVVDERSADWRDHQKEYAALVRAAAQPGQATPDVPLSMQQHYLPEMGVVDRCTSCHIGVDNPEMAGEAQPHGTHPGTWLDDHPPERFGCTPWQFLLLPDTITGGPGGAHAAPEDVAGRRADAGGRDDAYLP